MKLNCSEVCVAFRLGCELFESKHVFSFVLIRLSFEYFAIGDLIAYYSYISSFFINVKEKVGRYETPDRRVNFK